MSFFNYSKMGLCAFLVACVTACTTPPQKYFPPPTDYVPIDQVQIPSRFDTVEITVNNFAIEAQKCVPQLMTDSQSIKNSLKNFPNTNIVNFGHASSANEFVLRKTTGFCMHRSSEKFPIFAAESFLETVNPEGVAPDITEEWYKQIALLIAQKGMAKVAYVMENGNAYLVTYWVQSSPASALIYSKLFQKAGTWEKEKLDVRFSYPTMATLSETKRNGETKKYYPLAHRKN
jgi:hypothetical protein